MEVDQAIVALARAAVEAHPVTFGVPGGGRSLELADAVEGAGGRFLTTTSEAAAAVMAGTLGRLTGRPGLAVGIKGPGLAVMTAGLAACRLESFPMVAAVEAYGAGPRSTVHKELDHGALSTAVAKAHLPIVGAECQPADAMDLAADEVPGPVIAELVVGSAQPTAVERAPAVTADARRMLDRASRPVIVAGTLAIRAGVGDALGALGVPVFTTAAAKGAVDERLAHAAGVLTGAGGPLAPESTLLAQADLIVGIGLRAKELLDTGRFPCPVVEFGPSAGDALAELAGRAWGAAEVATALEAVRAHLDTGAFLPASVLGQLAARWPDVRLVVDTGEFCTVAEHVWRAATSTSYLGSGQARFMGIGIPMAIAAALHDGAPTALLVGDGGIGPAFAELRIAVAHRLPVLILLMADGGFGSIRRRALAAGLSPRSLDVDSTAWCGVADALGIPAMRVDHGDAFAEAIDTWQPIDGPTFIEARFDPDHYRTMAEGLR